MDETILLPMKAFTINGAAINDETRALHLRVVVSAMRIWFKRGNPLQSW